MNPDTVEAIKSYLANGPMKTADLVAAGFTRSTLSRAARAEHIIRVGQGHYMTPNAETNSLEDWALLSKRIPNLVLCLFTAAIYHGTTQNQTGDIYCAVPIGNSIDRAPTTFPVPVRMTRWNPLANPGINDDGIDTLLINDTEVRITSPERTLVDMFRYSELNPSRKKGTAVVGDEDFFDCLHRTMGRSDVDQDFLWTMCEKNGFQRSLRPLLTNTNYAIHQAPAA